MFCQNSQIHSKQRIRVDSRPLLLFLSICIISIISNTGKICKQYFKLTKPHKTLIHDKLIGLPNSSYLYCTSTVLTVLSILFIKSSTTSTLYPYIFYSTQELPSLSIRSILLTASLILDIYNTSIVTFQ